MTDTCPSSKNHINKVQFSTEPSSSLTDFLRTSHMLDADLGIILNYAGQSSSILTFSLHYYISRLTPK